jgi:hypothetical protein
VKVTKRRARINRTIFTECKEIINGQEVVVKVYPPQPGLTRKQIVEQPYLIRRAARIKEIKLQEWRLKKYKEEEQRRLEKYREEKH